jgi:hypothetical protein
MGGAGHERDAGAAPQRFRRNRVAHPAARTVADETHGVDIFERRPGGDQDAARRQRRGLARVEQLLCRVDDVLGLGEAAFPDPAARQVTRAWIDHVHAARDQGLEILRDRGVLEHVGVHRRRDHHGRARRGVERRQEVVRQAVGELADGVRGRRRDQQ